MKTFSSFWNLEGRSPVIFPFYSSSRFWDLFEVAVQCTNASCSFPNVLEI